MSPPGAGVPLRKRPLLAAALLTLSLLPHLPALWADFTNDDFVFFERNASIRQLELPALFGSSFPPEDPARGLYRPLTALSYALDYRLAGLQPWLPHLHNLLLYGATLLLLLLVLRRYLASARWALAGCLLFSLHPLHCEVVDSVTGRSELLGLLLGLGCLLLFLRALGFGARAPPAHPLPPLLGSWLCYLGACFAKETSVVLPGVLALHVLLFHWLPAAGSSWRRKLSRALLLLPYFAFVPLYLSIRMGVLQRMRPAFTILGEEDLLTRLWTCGAIWLEYLRLLFFPGTLQVDFYYFYHKVGIHHASSTASIGGLTLLALVLGLLAFLLLSAPRQAWARRPAFALGAFFVFLFPVSHIVPFGALMAERFLYAPSFGFALLTAVALRAVAGRLSVPAWRRAALALAALALLLLGLRSGLRAAEWKNTLTIWQPLLERFPDDHRIHNNIANGYLRQDRHEEALPYVRASLKLAPEHGPSLNNLALILMETGQPEQAAAAFQRVVEADPNDHLAWNGLGSLANRRLDHSRARDFYQRALQANPNYGTAAQNLAATEAAIAKARRFLEAEREGAEESGDASELRKVGQACLVVGDYGCAERYLGEDGM